MTEFDTLDKNMKNKKNWHGDQDVYTQYLIVCIFFKFVTDAIELWEN